MSVAGYGTGVECDSWNNNKCILTRRHGGGYERRSNKVQETMIKETDIDKKKEEEKEGWISGEIKQKRRPLLALNILDCVCIFPVNLPRLLRLYCCSGAVTGCREWEWPTEHVKCMYVCAEQSIICKCKCNILVKSSLLN